MSDIDPRLSFLKPGKAATQPAPETAAAEPDATGAEQAPQASQVDARLDLGRTRPPAAPRLERLSWGPMTMIRAGVMAGAFAAGAAQIASSLANAPPPTRGDAAVAASRTAPSQVIRVTAEARQAVSGGPVTWRAFFDHYDLPDSAREASMRRALGNLSPTDLDAAADAPIPQDRDIEIVLAS